MTWDLVKACTVAIYTTDGDIKGTIDSVDSYFDPFQLPNALNVGDKGSQVRLLQENLRRLDFFTDDPTGFFDSATRAAVSNFQRTYGLKPNGIADLETLTIISQSVYNNYQPKPNYGQPKYADYLPIQGNFTQPEPNYGQPKYADYLPIQGYFNTQPLITPNFPVPTNNNYFQQQY